MYNTPDNAAIARRKNSRKRINPFTTFTVTPDEGYQIASVQAYYMDPDTTFHEITFIGVPDDLQVGGEYAFVMPASEVFVEVAFEEIAYDVTLDLTGEATIKLNDIDNGFDAIITVQ